MKKYEDFVFTARLTQPVDSYTKRFLKFNTEKMCNVVFVAKVSSVTASQAEV